MMHRDDESKVSVKDLSLMHCVRLSESTVLQTTTNNGIGQNIYFGSSSFITNL